jgi:hypothetical protein
MEDVGILYGHLVYLIAIWHILRFFGIFKVIWYILPVLVSCRKKTGNPGARDGEGRHSYQLKLSGDNLAKGIFPC